MMTVVMVLTVDKICAISVGAASMSISRRVGRDSDRMRDTSLGFGAVL